MIVDSHTHVLPDEFRLDKERRIERDATFRAMFSSPKAKSVSAETLIAEMDGSGVSRSVIAGYGWTDLETAQLANDYLLESAPASGGRLVPLCSVNPIWGQDAVKEIERCHEAGAKGIGELHPDTQNFLDADFATLAPFFGAAREMGMPVLIHASEPVGHSYPGKGTVTPEYSLALAQAFPQNVIVFAHFGGGLPVYSLMKEVRRDLQNVYFDSAAAPLLYSPEMFDVCATAAGKDRILFGSDFPLVSQRRAIDDYRKSRDAGPNEAATLCENAASVWSIT